MKVVGCQLSVDDQLSAISHQLSDVANVEPLLHFGGRHCGNTDNFVAAVVPGGYRN
jgi:hypothetical protein